MLETLVNLLFPNDNPFKIPETTGNNTAKINKSIRLPHTNNVKRQQITTTLPHHQIPDFYSKSNKKCR